MKPKPASMVWSIALTAVLSLVAAQPCAAQLPATDLGVPDGCDNSHATAMNNSGQIVGYCAKRVWDQMEGSYVEDFNTRLPVVWQNGTMTPLPLLAGFTAGFAEAINSSGQIVGGCRTAAGSLQACLWTGTGTGWTVIGLGVPAGCTGSLARMINDAGQIVVEGLTDHWPWSELYFRDSQGNDTLLQDTAGNLLFPRQMNGSGQIVAQVNNSWGAALWNAGAVTELVPWVYDVWINDLGQVAGSYTDSSSGTGVESDFIYLPAAAYGLDAGLHTWPVSTKGGYFGGINNAGQVLLVPRPAPDGADYFTTDVNVIQLGGSVSYQVTVPGDTSFQRVKMNGMGQVAGTFSTADSGESSFYADPVTGLTLLDGLGGRRWRPEGLNDSGMIFGNAELADETWHATMWMAPGTYSWSGVLQPINSDGTSVFKTRSTVPVKFKLTGGSAGITDLEATLSYALISDGVAGSINETVSTSAATTGNLFRYDPTAGQYLFNWSTRGLPPGTYRLFINLGDGVEHTVDVGLR